VRPSGIVKVQVRPSLDVDHFEAIPGTIELSAALNCTRLSYSSDMIDVPDDRIVVNGLSVSMSAAVAIFRMSPEGASEAASAGCASPSVASETAAATAARRNTLFVEGARVRSGVSITNPSFSYVLRFG
jgi:hypothetical protein